MQELGRFPPTRWSLIDLAGREDKEGLREALAHLLSLYMPALRAHLSVRRRIPADRAEDLLMGFITDKVVEQDLIGRADQKKGRFRGFLVASLDHYVASRERSERADKRGANAVVSLDASQEDPVNRNEPADAFDLAWARELLVQVLSRMEEECLGTGKGDIWGIFEGRILNPALYGVDLMPYEALARRFGFASPLQAANALTTAKRIFDRQLRASVVEYAPEGDVEEEIADLKRILSRGFAE